MKSPPTVVVVGAGLAGLAAAVRLRALGAEVRVLDPTAPGGKARTIARDGWRFENGPHSFTHRADAIFAFAQELRVAERIVKLGRVASSRYLVRDGRLRRVGLFGGAIPLGDLWAVARGVFRSLPMGAAETVRDFLLARFGASFADGPGDAMMGGIWASAPDEVGIDAAFPVLAAAVRERGSIWRALRSLPRGRPAGTYGFPDGMGTLADAARESLGERVFGGCAASALSPQDTGWLLDTAAGQVRADALVVATDARSAAELLAPIAPEAAELLRGVRYVPLAVAHWLSPDAALPKGFGWLAPHRENRGVLGTIFVSDLFPGRAPAGRRAFATMLGGSRRPDDAVLGADAVRERIAAEHLSLTGAPVTIEALEVIRHARAVATPAPGHPSRVSAIHAALPDGVCVAGAWCGAGAMNDAVHAGLVAAANIWRFAGSGKAHAA